MSSGGGKGGQQGPFEYGPSAFDMQAIMNSLGQNQQSIQNRYNQLGLGNSTMVGQDLTQAGLEANAAIGQEQTQDVTNPALNPALQGPSSGGTTAISTLGSLGGLASSINQAGQSGGFGTGASVAGTT